MTTKTIATPMRKPIDLIGRRYRSVGILSQSCSSFSLAPIAWKAAVPGYCTAMSKENVEQQYRAADAFSRRDLAAFLAICDPDIELVSRHLELDGSGHLRGHA